jgi:hypothetical protein
MPAMKIHGDLHFHFAFHLGIGIPLPRTPKVQPPPLEVSENFHDETVFLT